MIATTVLLSLLVLTGLGFGLVYVYRRFWLSFEQEEEMAELKSQAMVMAIRQQVTFEFLDEMKRSRIIEGKGLGYEEIAKAMPMIYGRHFDAMISQMDENTKRIVEGELAKYRLAMGNGNIQELEDKLKLAASNNKTLRENQEELTKQRDSWKRRYETAKETKAVTEPGEGRQEAVESQEDIGSEVVAEPSQTAFKPALEPSKATPMGAKIRSFTPEFHYDDTHRSYAFDFEEGQDGLQVILKRKVDDKELGRFNQVDLTRGEVLTVAGKYIILCGLPSCNVVKITQQSTTRCCCRSHTNQLRILEAENELLGNG